MNYCLVLNSIQCPQDLSKYAIRRYILSSWAPSCAEGGGEGGDKELGARTGREGEVVVRTGTGGAIDFESTANSSDL